jgi:hypothetical protein
VPDSSYPPPPLRGYFAAMCFAFMGLRSGHGCKILNSCGLLAKYRLQTACVFRILPVFLLSFLFGLNEKAARVCALAAFFFCFKYSELGGCHVPRETPCLARGFAGFGLDSDFCPESFCRERKYGKDRCGVWNFYDTASVSFIRGSSHDTTSLSSVRRSSHAPLRSLRIRIDHPCSHWCFPAPTQRKLG